MYHIFGGKRYPDLINEDAQQACCFKLRIANYVIIKGEAYTPSSSKLKQHVNSICIYVPCFWGKRHPDLSNEDVQKACCFELLKQIM